MQRNEKAASKGVAFFLIAVLENSPANDWFMKNFGTG